jgi:hypothetical protein
MLHEATMPEDQLKRWLLAYWCYYHAGVASYIAEAPSTDGYWARMYSAAINTNNAWPRGMERRHFRGKIALAGVNGLKDWEKPESVVDYMTHYDTFDIIFKHVQEFPQFGPWIAWKIADMAERVLKYHVDFSNCDLGIYRDPVKGAAFIKYGDKEHDITRPEVMEVADEIIGNLTYLAPPHYDRMFNIQEAETVLCKYKAHNGHKNRSFYHVGKDTHDVWEATHEGWGDLAQELADKLPLKELYWWHHEYNIETPMWLHQALTSPLHSQPMLDI